MSEYTCYHGSLMYIERIKAKPGTNTKTQILLRESYREQGAPRSRVKHRTLLNLTQCPDHIVAAVEWAVKNKSNIESLALADPKKVKLKQGKSAGAVWLAFQLARRLGLEAALGSGREGRLALWQVIARLLSQGSRLSAVRLAGRAAACEILGLDSFSEDDLYANLAALADNQERIERRLFAARRAGPPPSLYLYDVTSSYLEGACNELAAYGYNRDGKRGKLQIVIGLLCDATGEPIAVRVFEGNTPDQKTVAEQARTLADSFGVRELTLVGDRGMLKTPQIEALPEGFRYLTAITKPQIRSLLAEGVLQLGLFDDRVCEVEHDGARYVLRRNPVRAAEMAESRVDKLRSLQAWVEKRNAGLAAKPKAKIEIALRDAQEKAANLRIDGWTRIVAAERALTAEIDEAARAEAATLDGCYALKSDVPRAAADAQTLHDRYKDLTEVEHAFRTMKTAHLEVRPIYVRKEKSTRGHVLAVMLAYILRRELAWLWRELDCTVEEGLDELKNLCAVEVEIDGVGKYHEVPTPSGLCEHLFDLCAIAPPKYLPTTQAMAASKRKLPTRRKAP